MEAWVRGYVEAWESNDPEAIGRLFTDEARYWTAPYREPWTGRQGIVDGWLERPDTPGTWDFRFEVQDVCGDRAYVRGWTRYPPEDEEYSNLWAIRLADDGRCSEFVEWWMRVGST